MSALDNLPRLTDEEREALDTGIAMEGVPMGDEPAIAPSLKQRLTVELDTAHLAMDLADNFVHVCNFALRHQDCDIDGAAADVLDMVHEKIDQARTAIMNIVDMLPEVSDATR